MSKPHLPVLDGLRGTAALCVMIFHFQQASVGYANPDGFWLRHAYIAVDFFFCLSGYVVGYAYDDRRTSLGIRGFFAVRLIRLHPLVIIAALVGLAAYTLDPFNAAAARALDFVELQEAPWWRLAICTVAAMLLIPALALPNSYGSLFPLNPPIWSLMCEYVGNIFYALVLWRLRKIWLILIVIAAGAGVAAIAYSTNRVATGWSWEFAGHGFVRMIFQFSAGLLLFRCGIKLKTPLGFGLLSLAMLLLFMAPGYGNPEAGSLRFNWIIDIAALLFLIPLIVALGAGADSQGVIGRICRFSGRISYPLYAVHYPIVAVFLNYTLVYRPSLDLVPWVIAALVLLNIALAYVILRFIDEPVRRALTLHYRGRQQSPTS